MLLDGLIEDEALELGLTLADEDDDGL